MRGGHRARTVPFRNRVRDQVPKGFEAQNYFSTNRERQKQHFRGSSVFAAAVQIGCVPICYMPNFEKNETKTTRNAKSCVRFSSKQVKRVSYVGGDKGTLSRHDVLRALEELEVRVDGWEADALLDRFAVEDGDDKVILFRCVTNVGICFTN